MVNRFLSSSVRLQSSSFKKQVTRFFTLVSTAFLLSLSLSANAISDYYEQAKQSYDEGNYEASFIYLKNALEQNPRDLPSKILMGKILLHRAYFEESIREFKEALDYKADMNLIVADYAAALNFAKRYKEVLNFADGHQLTNNSQFELLLNKAIAYKNLDLTVLARRSYEQALRLKPAEQRGYNTLASFEIGVGNLEAAERLAKKSISLNPSDNRTIHLLGRILAEKGKFVQAIEQFEFSLEIMPDDPVVERSLVRAYIQTEQLDKAKQLVDKILIATPTDPHIMLLSSWLLSIEKEDQKSIKMLESLSSATSTLSDDDFTNDPSLLFVSSISSYLLGNYEQAIKELKRYLNLEPGDTRAITTLSDIYLKRGKRQEAELLLERYESSVINDQNLAKTLVDLFINNGKRFDAERLLAKLRIEYPNDIDFLLRQVDLLNNAGRKKEANALIENVDVQDEKNSLKLNIARGMMFLENLQLDKADEVAEKLTEAFPDNNDIKNYQAAIFIKRGDAESAQALLEEILSKTTSFVVEFNLATALKMQSKDKEAQAILEKLLEQRPESAQVRYMLGQIYAKQQEFVKAIPLLEPLRTGKVGTQSKELLFDIFMATGEYSSAQRIIKELNETSLYNIGYLFDYVAVLTQLDDVVQAKKQLGILYGLAENNARMLLDIGMKQRDINDFEGADKTFEKLLKILPKNLRVRIESIRLTLAKGEIKQADKDAKALEKQVPNEQNVMLLRGDIELSKGQNQTAFDYYWRALKIDPAFNLAVIKLYELAKLKVNVEQTTNKLIELAQLYPDQIWRKRLLADHYMNHHQDKQALALYEELYAIEAYQQDAYLLNNMALLTMDSDISKALTLSKQAKELNSTNASITDTLGWIYYNMEHTDEALQTLRNAFAMDSSSPTIRYHIGLALLKLQRFDDAKKELDFAIKKGKSKKWYQDAVNALQSIDEQKAAAQSVDPAVSTDNEKS